MASSTNLGSVMQLETLVRSGREVIVVTSGAVAVGKTCLAVG